MTLPGVLSQAELVLQAKNYSGSGSWLDESGNGHDAALPGGTSDPLFKQPDSGSQYLYLPGTSGNELSVTKDAGWGATIEWVVTYTDDTTETGTTTADPVLVGGTTLSKTDVKTVALHDGVGGTEVALFVAANRSTLAEPFTSQVDGYGITWTINRSSSGVPATVVDRPMWLFDGTDDYMTIADHANLDLATGEAATALVVYREPARQTGSWAILYKGAGNGTGGDPGWNLRILSSGNFVAMIEDTTQRISDYYGSAIPLGTLVVVGAVYDKSTPLLQTYLDAEASPTSSSTSTGDSSNAQNLTIGSGIGYIRGQVMAVVLWRKALTQNEIVSAGQLLAGASGVNLPMLGVG